jgi:hypothetical protein
MKLDMRGFCRDNVAVGGWTEEPVDSGVCTQECCLGLTTLWKSLSSGLPDLKATEPTASNPFHRWED